MIILLVTGARCFWRIISRVVYTLVCDWAVSVLSPVINSDPLYLL